MKACKFYLLLLLLWASFLSPHVAFSQAESHNFITYDTTYNVGYAGLYYIFRITRPKNMFVGGDPDWADRPAIIQMGGAGEVGSNAALTAVNGPHYWLANGWDGSVQLANGTHYPIIISVQAGADWPQTTELLNMLKYILNTYHIKKNSVHLCGLSMGAFSWSALICHQSTPGGEDGMKLVTSLVCLEGQSTGVSTAVIPNVLGGSGSFASFGHWAKKYGGKFFGLEGTADYRNVGAVSTNMNDSVAGSAYFSYESIGGGAHCCWNSMYNPSVTNWTSVGTLAPNLATGASPNAMGTYKAPMNIFQWMLSQGDITLVNPGTGTPTPSQPVVNAGTAQSITLPTNSLTLTGAVTGTGPFTYAWTQVSGPGTATIATANAVNTVVSGLQAGTYVFQLAATDNASLTGTGTVQVVVNPAANVAPTVSSGSSQTVTLPVAQVTLTGSATPAAGTTIASYSWTQVSGGASVITSPSSATTTITGLVAGTNVYRLTVTSSGGASATSDVTVTVNPPVVVPPVVVPPVVVPPVVPGTGLTVKKVITCEYRVWYIASDDNIYSWNNGSLNVMQFPIGGRKAVDGAGGFNEFRVLDDQGYIWSSKIDFTTNTIRFDTDSSGAPFNGNASVYAYGSTTLTIKSDGSVWLFGNDTMHLFHTTGGVNMRAMQLSPAGMQFKKLVMGNRIVGLTTSGDVYEWTYGGSRTPVKKTIPSPAIDIFGSHLDYFGCIIPAAAGGTTGYPYVWGSANRAWGGTTPYTEPTSVQTLWGVVSPIAQISADWNTTHYIDDQGRMWGFGFNVSGEVGNGTEMANQYNYAAPYSWDFSDYAAPSGLPFQEIGKGVKWSKFFSNNFFCFYKYAMDVNDSVYSWGRNKAIVLGNGLINQQEQYYPNALDVLAPTMVHPLTAIYQPYKFTLPSLSAGNNQTITTTTAVLTGVVIAPLLVKTTAVANNKIDTAGYKIVSYLWTKVSGTGGTITSPNSLSTTITGLTPGTYVFNLKTTDNNTGTLSSNVTITVNTPGSGTPVANAGSDQTITLPTNSATLTGSGTVTSGTITSYQWTQLSGPSTASIAAANLAQTTVNNLAQGVYIFQLTVKDATGATATDAVTVTVNAAPVVPGPPSANAGSNQTITLPTSSATLTGSGSETNGTIASYAWTQVSGPATATLGTAGQAATTVSGLVQGQYQFQLKVTDNSGVTATDVVNVTVNPAVPVPGTPVANAGSNQTITLPASSVTLTGSGSETNGTIASYAWTQVSGPATATLGTAGQAATTVSGLVQGVYRFQLQVTDASGVKATATVQVTVNSAPAVPGAPSANAGSDQTITLPASSVTLTGSGSETNGTIASYAWTQVSGPGTATLGTAGQAATTVSGLVPGVYQFQLKVTDALGVTATDVVTVTVNAAPVNQPPVANAGPDQTVAAGTITLLDGSASYDPDGTIVKYQWIQLSGRGGVTITNSNSSKPSLYGLTQGVFVFQLDVTDNGGATASDQVTITVTDVTPPPAVLTPVAMAGKDTIIFYPAETTATLDGSASYETGGSIATYSWKQVSGPSTAVFNNSLSAIAKVSQLNVGDYVFELTVTDAAGAGSTATVTVHVKSDLRNSGFKVRLYPNPVLVNQNLNVEVTAENPGLISFTIYDIGGRMVKRIVASGQLSTFQQAIPITGMSRGVYVLMVESDGKIHPYRFVVD